MSLVTQLFQLDDAKFVDEYVGALFGELKAFLRSKQPGHCQRLDYLPRTVMARLAERLANDAELLAGKIVCRVVTDKSNRGDLQPWEVTGSGAVALREDATYGRINVFCALFPTGIRLAEEDSLNVATFKTDDAESFDAKKSLERHVHGKANMLLHDEGQIIKAILENEAIRPKPVQTKLRYVLALLGQQEQSQQPISWEMAGAYLYELGLLPDFDLDKEMLSVKLARNVNCAEILGDGEKTLTQNLDRLVAEKGLTDENKRRELAVYLADQDMLRPDIWLPPICHDEDRREKLSFDTWTFSEPTKGIKIELIPLQDPKNPHKVASGLAVKDGALTNDGKKAISIKWKVTPRGTQVIGGYRVYVIRQTEEQGEVDVIAPQQVSAKRISFMVPMADNNLEEDEKCVARIRLQAVNTNGIPIQDAQEVSEEFWIENGEEITPAPPERGQRLRHLDELLFHVTYKTGKRHDARSRGWDAKRDNVYSVRLTNNARGDLVLNPLLRALEHKMLLAPETLGVYEANLVNRRTAAIDDFTPCDLSPAVNQCANDFYEARKEFFRVVYEREDSSGVIEVTRLHDIAHEVLRYVQEYDALISAFVEKVRQATGPGGVNTVLHDYAALMRIDTVHLTVGPAGDPLHVLLLAPTHPLRVLWLYQYETFVEQWIAQMDGKTPDDIGRLIAEESLDKLVNLNIPNALAWAQGQTYINTDNLDFFWSVLPAADVKDLRTAVNAARQAVGATHYEAMVSTVTPQQIADKMERYLCHHPYVRTLKLNVINPGDGTLLLEAITRLLGKPHRADLNFDIKFFAPAGTRHQLVGNAFDDFMLQRNEDDWWYGKRLSETEEHLLRPNANPLFPKLVYAKHQVGELLADKGNRFDAHLSFIIDFFGTTVATRAHEGQAGSSSLHNLLAEYLTDYTAGASTATWSRLVAPSRCPDLASDGTTGKLYTSHDGLSHLTASYFDWGKSLEKYITVQLELTDAHDKNHFQMLRRVHLSSDWVFTIDRNFGVEFYDDPTYGPTASHSKGYLIDYTPEFLDAVSHRLIISTYHEQEIESILRKGFAALLSGSESGGGTVIDPFRVMRILQVLKSVSGKLALKLINNPHQAQEVIGLALTRLALEQEGRLTGRVLIPVDSHLDLFFQTNRELENSELTLKRTDLILAELRGRTLHLDLIEVKNRQYATPHAMVELQSAIRDKNQNTEAHFRANFLGDHETKRFDAEIKNKQLANILSFYFDRAQRYGTFKSCSDNPLEREATALFIQGLEAVAAGACEVTYRHQGYIFNGSSLADTKQEVIYNNDMYTIGRPGIQGLLGLVMDEDEDQDEGGRPVETPDPRPIPPDRPGTGISASHKGSETHEAAPSVPPVSPPEADHTTSGEASRNMPSPHQPPLGMSTERTTSTSPSSVPGEREAEPQDINIYLGTDCITGEAAFWNPYTTTPRRLANQHVLVVGKSGSGKSETTKALIWELDRRGIPSVILDYQGEYATGDFYNAVMPQVFDVMQGLPINPFELPFDPVAGRKRAPIEMMFRLADTLNTVFRGSGDIQLGVLREAIEECYRQQGFQPYDSTTWANEPPTLDILETVLDHMASDRGAQVRNLQVRLQPLFRGGIFRQDKAAFQFDDLFKRTSVILLTAGIKDLMFVASRFMLEKIYATMLMAGVTKQLRVMVVIDEAHKLCGDETIISLIKEARKYGLGLILSSQETRDFHPSAFANTGTLIALGLEDADATVMANHLGLMDKQSQRMAKELMLTQSSGQALIRSQHFLPYAQIRVQSFEERVRSQ